MQRVYTYIAHLRFWADPPQSPPVSGQGVDNPQQAFSLRLRPPNSWGQTLLESEIIPTGENPQFTGIVEEIGNLKAVQKGRHSAVLRIQAKKILEDVHIGDSIAVNGICLTVTEFTQSGIPPPT